MTAAAQSTTIETHQGLTGVRLFLAILAWSLGFAMSTIDQSITNVALPLIARELHTSPAQTIWVVNAFQIATAVFVLPMSSLADIIGYKRVYQCGLALFTVASAMCGMSHTLEWLIAGRLLQGAGAGAMVACLTSFMRVNYPPGKLGMGIAINSMIVTGAISAGPAVASAILSVASWPWLFSINVPFCLVALVLTEPMLLQGHALGHKWDFPSALLNGLAFTLFIVGVQTLGHPGGQLYGALSVAAALGFLYLLIRRQLALPAPMLGVDLLRIPLIAVSCTTSVFCFIAQAMAMVVLPFLIFSQQLGPSAASAAGLLMTAWPVGAFVAAPTAARLGERFSAGALGAFGMATFGLSVVSLIFLPPLPGAWDLLWRIFMCGFAFGFFGQTNLRTIVSSAPRERSGAAGGINTTFRLLGQSTGTALVAVIFGLFGGGHATPQSIHLVLITTAVLSAVGTCISCARIKMPRPQYGAG